MGSNSPLCVALVSLCFALRPQREPLAGEFWNVLILHCRSYTVAICTPVSYHKEIPAGTGRGASMPEPTPLDRAQSLVLGHAQACLENLLQIPCAPEPRSALLSGGGWTVVLLAFPTPVTDVPC